MRYIPSGLIVFLAVAGLLHATARAKATKKDGALVFGPTPMIRSLLLVLIVGFAGAALYAFFAPPRSPIGTVIFGFISIAGTVAFPRSVLVTSEGVSEIKWWGAKTVILWKDVNRIEYHKGSATTVVLSKTGTQVVHSGFNRDTFGFRTLCEEKSGVIVKTSEV